MAIEEKKAEISWEEAVSRFLKDNPDYFQRNPHLLNQLEIPHHDTGQAVSLIERQVLALRQDNEALESQLGQLVDNATENDAVAGQLHRFTLALMASTSARQVIELVTDVLKTSFNLDLVLFKLFSDADSDTNADIEGHAVSLADSVVKHLADQVTAGQAVCGISFTKAEARHLFDSDSAPDGSLALISVRHEKSLGLLIIGSHDDGRFVADMATTYLDRIGELVGAAISQFHDT